MVPSVTGRAVSGIKQEITQPSRMNRSGPRTTAPLPTTGDQATCETSLLDIIGASGS